MKDGHREKKDFIQRLLKRVEQLALIVLHRKLSENEDLENAIPKSDTETNAHHINLSLIFLFLFQL